MRTITRTILVLALAALGLCACCIPGARAQTPGAERVANLQTFIQGIVNYQKSRCRFIGAFAGMTARMRNQRQPLAEMLNAARIAAAASPEDERAEVTSWLQAMVNEIFTDTLWKIPPQDWEDAKEYQCLYSAFKRMSKALGPYPYLP
jgi:hypothetical protein